MQIAAIVQSLRHAATANPMAAALSAAGLAGGIHYGTRASRAAERPFALLSVNEVSREFNSSGVTLVTYEVSIAVYVDQRVNVAANILAAFHAYWDRLASLADLVAGEAEFVLIRAEDTQIGEADETDFGKDVILGVTSWTLRLSEHQPELVE